MRKLFLILAALALTATLSGSARADSCTLTGINTGVTATVNITNLTSNLLTFTITNTSTASITGKITSIGFDLPGSAGGAFTIVSATNSNYGLATQVAGNAAGIGRIFDFALLTGPGFNGGGNPNRGVVEGASATFIISGNFAGMTQQQILSGLFARFQDVNTGGGSDVAQCCNPPEPVPEPATMVLLGSGLLGLAARMRRRKSSSSAE